ncbi:MAG: inorganic diphosphatase [Candidatus Dormibacteraeota bacterium]|nr:inorganic diphosphatase [Candidatus Dormibacteraeota bacterium]MBO0761988.1 inorganic diphosphatase [Candidatus Dormibacteraeota bacterium]
MEIDVVVEVPMGSRNKYEIDHETGEVWLDRQLFTSARYPADYGFIKRTLAEDGDPLDVLVAVDEPTFPGCHIRCRPLGMIDMRDEAGPDSKILAVPVWELRHPWRELEDVPEALLREMRHFFGMYKDLEAGKHTDVRDWLGRATAESEIEAALDRYRGRR